MDKNQQTNAIYKEITYGITGKNLTFLGECYANVSFMSKKFKLKAFIMDQSWNLFELDGIFWFMEPANKYVL